VLHVYKFSFDFGFFLSFSGCLTPPTFHLRGAKMKSAGILKSSKDRLVGKKVLSIQGRKGERRTSELNPRAQQHEKWQRSVVAKNFSSSHDERC
jgi:hypothetical protein